MDKEIYLVLLQYFPDDIIKIILEIRFLDDVLKERFPELTYLNQSLYEIKKPIQILQKTQWKGLTFIGFNSAFKIKKKINIHLCMKSEKCYYFNQEINNSDNSMCLHIGYNVFRIIIFQHARIEDFICRHIELSEEGYLLSYSGNKNDPIKRRDENIWNLFNIHSIINTDTIKIFGKKGININYFVYILVVEDCEDNNYYIGNYNISENTIEIDNW